MRVGAERAADASSSLQAGKGEDHQSEYRHRNILFTLNHRFAQNVPSLIGLVNKVHKATQGRVVFTRSQLQLREAVFLATAKKDPAMRS